MKGGIQREVVLGTVSLWKRALPGDSIDRKSGVTSFLNFVFILMS